MPFLFFICYIFIFFWMGSLALKQIQFLFYDRHIMTFIPILVLFFFQTSETCMSYFSAKKLKEALLQCLHTTTRWNEKEAEHPLWDFDLDAELILCGMQMLPRMPPPTEELHIIKIFMIKYYRLLLAFNHLFIMDICLYM